MTGDVIKSRRIDLADVFDPAAGAENGNGNPANSVTDNIAQSAGSVKLKSEYIPEPLPTAEEYRAKYDELFAYHMKRGTPPDLAKECVSAYLTRALWPGYTPPDDDTGGAA
jgi:hypothetical protein